MDMLTACCIVIKCLDTDGQARELRNILAAVTVRADRARCMERKLSDMLPICGSAKKIVSSVRGERM